MTGIDVEVVEADAALEPPEWDRASTRGRRGPAVFVAAISAALALVIAGIVAVPGR